MKIPLSYRIRKRLAVEYGNLIRKFMPNYFKKQMRTRRGTCPKGGCDWVFLCCGRCSYLDSGNFCTRYEARPTGCWSFPIDDWQINISGMKCSKYTWK